MTKTLTPAEAATILDRSEAHVRDLCQRKYLRARKAGRDWRIDPLSVEEYKQTRRPPGRPRKE